MDLKLYLIQTDDGGEPVYIEAANYQRAVNAFVAWRKLSDDDADETESEWTRDGMAA